MKIIKKTFFVVFVFTALGFAQAADSTQIKKLESDFNNLNQKLTTLLKQQTETNNQIEQIKGAMAYIQAQYAEEIKKVKK